MRLRRGAIALALCAPLGCAPAPGSRPARPAPAVGQVKHYQPLEMAGDARQAGQAVILGTDEANGSTVLALPAAPTPVVVDAMTVARADAAGGASHAIVLTSAPAPGAAIAATATTTRAAPGDAEPAAPVQVGGGDDGAAGARWRADAWSAALIATTALGKDLADAALSATPAGAVDGPASALLAGGFVAAMLGDTIDPAATLAGAIQPDGTIGPVAGLADQVAAAIARGRTRIGVPAGMRVVRSATSGKDVDLVQLAHSRRAELIELADVRDAYRLLTGRRLPAPVPVAAAAMALPPAALDRLEARYSAWQRKLAEEWAPLLQLEQAGRLPAAITVLMRVAHGRSEHAEALHRTGKPVAAYGDILAAWLYAAAANQTHAVIGKLAAGDLDVAIAALAALDSGDAGLRAAFGRIAGQPPATLAGQLTAIEALQAVLRGWAYHELAADSLRAATQTLGELRGKPATELGSPATAESAAAAIAPAVLRLLRAVAETTVAEQELDLAPDPGAGEAGGPACASSAAELTRTAAAQRQVAAAALAQLDALLVEPLARKAGIIADAARWRLAAIEPDYLIADQLVRGAASGLPHEIAAAWGEGSLGAGLLALAASRAAYHSAALVIAKYDALGVHSDDTGRITSVNHPQAFRALLASAERTARAAAHSAQVATGAIPVQARLAYQVAVIEAAGGLDDQLDALAELWSATAFSEAAVSLARSCR
jgi:hypothetical protein